MRVLVKFLIPLITVFFCFSYINYPVKADNLNDAITEYSREDYKKALILLKAEISKNPDNEEAYKWLAKTYEALFDIDKAMETYKKYEEIKKDKFSRASNTPIPSVKSSPSPQNNKPTAKPISTPNIRKPLPTATPNIRKPLPTATPNIKKPLPSATPTTGVLTTQSDGWKSISVINLLKEKKIKIISRDSMDLEEVEDYAGSDREFVLIECKIKYDKDIIIKSNSPQITLIDQNGTSYYLYAMSTYKFQYEGNKASKKLDALQAADYFQLSLKDSRPTITFVFKVESNNTFKELKIQGYENIDLFSFNH